MKSLRLALLMLMLMLAFWSSPDSAMAEDYATRMLRATCKIIHKDSTATCFLVESSIADPDKRVAVLVTANHVLNQMQSETAVLALRKRREDGGYARHEVTIAVRSGDKPLWIKHPTHDVAVLNVTLPNDVTSRPLPLACLASEESVRVAGIHIGQSMLAFSYPVRFEANAAGFPIARKLVLASHPLAPVKTHPVFLADMHTFPGDSGGPVFLLDPRSGRNADGGT
ncbi:MAG: serine protease, partial [Planctomycetaceae bacterium]